MYSRARYRNIRTEDHPNRESHEGEDAQLENEINVDSDGDRGHERQSWSLEHQRVSKKQKTPLSRLEISHFYLQLTR